MKFKCDTTCHDSAEVKTYHAELVYEFPGNEVVHLKEIDHLRRFTPVDEEAKAFMKTGRLPKLEAVEAPAETEEALAETEEQPETKAKTKKA